MLPSLKLYIMSKTRKTSEQERQVFSYLNDLRKSGVTNMFGATPYIVQNFIGIDKNKASGLLTLWMKNFKEDNEYNTIEY